MFGLRSARSRAILAGVVLVILLAGVATVAVWRAYDDQQRHHALERTSAAVTALEHAQTEFWQAQTMLSALIFSHDPALIDDYHNSAASIEQNLSQARAEALAAGEADHVAALDDLAARIGQFNDTANQGLPVLLEADVETGAQLATALMPGMVSEAEAIIADLEALVDEEQQELAATRAAADRAADTTLWLLIGFSAAAFLAATGTIAMLIVSLVRPLAALRASATAITSGDLEARAKVSGPEEVASLARDFNEMTDTLAAKTQEYIDTTNLTGDIIVKADKDGRFTFLNDAACQFFGKPKEELLGTDSTAFVHPEDIEPTGRIVREARTRKELIRGFVNRQITPMGTRLLEWNGYPLFDEQGQYAGLQATGRDITERKQAEEALQESEEKWRSLAENAPNIVLTADRDGTIQFINRTVPGAPPVEETIGMSIYDFIHPDYCDTFRKSLEQVFQTGKPGTYQLIGFGPGDRPSWYESHFGPIKRDGQVVAVALINTDITDRKRMERALRESEERHRAIFEQAADSIVLIDAETGALVQFNDRAHQALGYTREEFEKLRIPDFEAIESAEEVAKHIGKMVKEGADTFETKHRTKSGEIRHFEVRCRALSIQGRDLVQAIGRDITERKQLEEALRESEERFRSLSASAPIGVFLTDLQGDCVYINPRLQAISGLTLEESLGYNWSKVIHPDDRATVVEAASRTTRQAGELSLEFRILTPEGELRWAHVHTSPMFSTQRKQTGRVGTLEDITDRKRAEEALRQSEERLRDLFENANDLIQSVAPDGSFVYVNRAWRQALGYAEHEIPTLSLHQIIHPDSKAHCMEVFKRAMAGEKLDHLETMFVSKDGRTIWVEGNAFCRFEDGKPVATRGIFRDITERKRAEEALRESESKYRTLLGNLPQRIFFKDGDSVYISCNDNYARDLHIIPDEIAGKTDHDFYPRELAEKYRADDKRIMKSGKTEDLEERYIQDGQEVFVHTVKTPVRDGNGNVIGILGIFWDITEQKRAQEERERLHAELQVRAITDSLTGLYNHAHFSQRLADEIERSKRYGRGFTVVMMDVDNFKQFNDSRGHQAGDEALCLVADCIRKAIRRSDIAFRYGGDEFAAILLHANSSKAQAIAKRMNGCLTRRLKEADDSSAAWLGISAGAACFPNDGTTADQLVRMADAALYDAKRVAWARGVTEQGQAIKPVASPSGAPDGKQPTVLSAAAGELAATLQELGMPDALADLDLRTIAAVAAAAEIKDPYIRDHQRRVSQWAAALAENMGLPPEQVQDIRTAGLLHDLGKVSVSEHILNKPGKLTEEEYAQIKEHAPLGAGVIVHIEGLQRLVPIVRHHHERFDGKGYPDGLAGEDIPLEARILAVADVFDAMTHERSYRKALSREKAIAELERGAGTQFDPAVVKTFLALLKERGAKPPAPAQAASEDRELAAARAPGRGKG